MDNVTQSPMKRQKQEKNKARANVSGKTHQAYDKFFRHSMERPEVAKDFICQFYPEETAKYFRFEGFRLCQGTFVDKAYRKQETDVLFELAWKDTPVLCYCLIEHFSEPDEMAAFRILKYMVAIMERYRKENGGNRLPLVLPLIFYPRDKQWPYPTDFRDLIQAPQELIDQVWNQPFPIAQGNDMQEDEIKRHRWASALAWLMNHSMRQDILERLRNSPILLVLKEFNESGGKEAEYAIELISHIIYTNSISRDALRQFLREQFSPKVEEQVMTLAQQLRSEGIQEGIQEGMLKGKMEGIQEGELKGIHRQAAETAMKLLRRGGYDLKEIAEISGLPLHEVELLTVE